MQDAFFQFRLRKCEKRKKWDGGIPSGGGRMPDGAFIYRSHMRKQYVFTNKE